MPHSLVAAAEWHAVYRIRNAPVQDWPFPHIHIDGIFPDDFYAELRRQFPLERTLIPLASTPRVGKGYSEKRLVLFHDEVDRLNIEDDKRVFWRDAFRILVEGAMADALLARFGDVLAPRLGPRLPDGRTPAVGGEAAGREAVGREAVRREAVLAVDHPNYALGPHTDPPDKVLSAIVYLAPDARRQQLGTSLYLPKQDGFTCAGGPHHLFDAFHHVATLPYRPNSLAAFPKTETCFHGVPPVRVKDGKRHLLLLDLLDAAAAPAGAAA